MSLCPHSSARMARLLCQMAWDSIVSLVLAALTERYVGDCRSGDRGRKARIESEVCDQSAELGSGDTILDRPSKVSGQLLEASSCNARRDGCKEWVAFRLHVYPS